MTSPQQPQTPPARVLLPLGIGLLVLAILAIVLLDLGLIPLLLAGVCALMGVGIVIQGIVNLRRDRK